MSVATLLAESTHDNAIAARRPALAGSGPGSSPGAVLVIAEQDPRLTWPERQLGAKLYGRRSEGDR